MQVPLPHPDDAVPVNSAGSVELAPGEKAIIEVEPEKQGNQHRIPMVAVDWLEASTYQVVVDETERYAESSVPPVDIDSPTVPFVPALDLRQKLTITIRDVREEGNPRPYRHRVIGWEV